MMVVMMMWIDWLLELVVEDGGGFPGSRVMGCVYGQVVQ